MATKVQRASNVLNALADKTIGNQLMLRIAEAFVRTYHPERDVATLTNEEKAGVVLRRTRAYVMDILAAAEANAAAEAARLEAIENARVDLGNDGDLTIDVSGLP